MTGCRAGTEMYAPGAPHSTPYVFGNTCDAYTDSQGAVTSFYDAGAVPPSVFAAATTITDP